MSSHVRFTNGVIFTGDVVTDALAIDGGRIVAVGRAQVDALETPDDVVDLAGGYVGPAFIDAHAHPVMGGLERTRCDLTGCEEDASAYRAAIAAYAARHDGPWILGGGWGMPAFEGGTPTAAMLDDIVADRPVALPNRDHHSWWVNSAALRIAGIDRSTPDPVDGRIERDADGNPTGTLHEGACWLVERVIPPTTQDELDRGLEAATDYLHSVGVVGWQDAWTRTLDGPQELTTYVRARERGTLRARVSAALWWERGIEVADVPTEVGRLASIRDSLPASDRLRAHTVKVMQDGVIETMTASLLTPYLDPCGHATANLGIRFLDVELLHAVVRELDLQGFDIHAHALGDRAVREVLDALEAAQAANPSRSRRHQLAHLQVVDPADVPRFAALGVLANCQALWAVMEEQMVDLTLPVLGDTRAAHQYPFGSLESAGTRLAFGSDWPVSAPDPLLALHTAVNRRSVDMPADSPALLPEQALDVRSVLVGYTRGSAHSTGLADVSGELAVGRPADLVVLDANPFAVDPSDLGRIQVKQTYLDGELVYSRD